MSASVRTTASRPSSGARAPLVFGTALMLAGVLPGFLTASLAPRIARDFAFGPSDLGVAVAVFYALSALGSTPAGRLVDRAGYVRGIRLSAALSGVACLAIAAFAGSAGVVTGLLVVAGAGNALASPAASALFRDEVPSERLGFAFGLLNAGAPLGALLAGLALPAIAIPFDWRWAFAGAAVAALAAAFGGGRPRAARAAAVPGDSGTRTPAAPAARGEVRVLGVVAALASGAAMGMVSFLVLFSVGSGLSEGAAGTLLAGVSLGAAIGRIAVGAIADRWAEDPLWTVGAMLVVSIPGYLLLLTGEPLGIVAGALVVGTAGWSWPGALALGVVQRSEAAPAWAIGVMMTGLFFGAMAGPFAVGRLVDAGHQSLPWLVCACVAAVGAGVAVGTASRQGT